MSGRRLPLATRFPADWATHPLILRLSPKAKVTFVELWCHCANFSKDAEIPVEIAVRKDGYSELLTVRLLRRDGTGFNYIMPWFLEVNGSAADVERRRKAARERMRRARGKPKKRRKKATGPHALTTAEAGSAGKAGGEDNPPPAKAPPAPVEPKKKKKKPEPEEPEPIVGYLCDLLADLIAANGIPRPKVGIAWYKPMRLLIDRDDFEPELIERAIRWATADEFWRTNILAPTSLRRHMQSGKLLYLIEKPPNRASSNGAAPQPPSISEVEAARDDQQRLIDLRAE